jgi:bla regulator protein BlaR1
MMDALQKIFSGAWAETLGWTLIHSLWQGLAICGIVFVLLKIFSRHTSQVRYLISCAGMMLMVIASAATFVWLMPSADNRDAFTSFSGLSIIENSMSSQVSIPLSIRQFIDANIFVVVTIWMAGAFIFTLRLLGGWWYLNRIRKEATEVYNTWSTRIEQIGKELSITRVIQLAESHLINSPMVVGYLKPMVLVPAGMLTGLTTSELETIFLHELAHIQRHDYLINVLQSVVEVIFFFNPFVWIVSNTIRKEREYCCDDLVLTNHGDAYTYAHALARLEESRISGHCLAVALADDKNLLLKRIKRIMEKSFKPNAGQNRILPVMLIVAGLLCASWATIHTNQNRDQEMKGIAADTTIKKNAQSARYSRRTVTITDENGEPKEVVVESFEGDNDLRPMVALGDFDALPEIPAIEAIPEIPAIDAISTIPVINAMPSIDINIPAIPGIPAIAPFGFYYNDTIPGKHFSFNDREWENFSKEFEQKFRERFSDFYQKNGSDFAKMMDEVKKNFEEHNFQNNWIAMRGDAMGAAELAFKEFDAAKLSLDDAKKAQEFALKAQNEAWKNVDALNKEQAAEMEQWSKGMKVLDEQNKEHFDKLEKEMKFMEENMHAFEKALKEQLIKDGYITKEDQIKEINWMDDGNISVNGKKIKESDKKTYQSLHDKYFKKGGNSRFVE